MLQRQDERRDSHVAAMVKALNAGGKAAALLDDFAAALYANAPYEDIHALAPDELAELAAESFTCLKTHKPGTTTLRVFNPDGEDGSGLERVTVIDIVNQNMPFLLDSAMAELTARGLDVRMVLHPILAVTRDGKGKLKDVAPRTRAAKDGTQPVSFIHIHVGRIDSDLVRKDLARTLTGIFNDVRTCVADWRAMLGHVDEAIAEFRDNPPPIPVEEIAEAVQFLEWLRDNNFTFLGMRQYDFVGAGEEARLERVEGGEAAGLGLLRDANVKVLRRGREFVTYTPEIRTFLMQPVPLIVTKANVKSTVHRRVHLDYIGVKRFDADGKLIGELRIIGVYTSTAYNKSVTSIPYLRRKAAQVMEMSGFDPESHTGKGLQNVLDTFPRDELFQIEAETLHDFAIAIQGLSERPRIRVLYRPDKFDRFVSIIVYVQRDRYNSDVRVRVGDYLARVFAGRVSAYYPDFPEGALARVHYIIGRNEGETPAPDQAMLEAEVAQIARTWDDALDDALAEHHEPLAAVAVRERYADAFSVAYQETFSAKQAVDDIVIIDRIDAGHPLAIAFLPHPSGDDGRLSLKVFNLDKPIPLSERVPMLENMGFRVISERSFQIARHAEHEAERIHLHEMVLQRNDSETVDIEARGELLTAAFMAIMQGRAEDDGYNALVLKAGIAWRDVAMLRSVSRYLRQVRIPYSQDYMWEALLRHTAITAKLVELFHARFKPHPHGGLSVDEARNKTEDTLMGDIEAALEAVPSLDDDRIVRRFANLIRATLRTNFFQVDPHGLPVETIAFKISSRGVEAMPDPRPYAEIFVYSPRVEGVHMRFGEIARGGLRWSDRPQDFRTEILGLVKAQQVKNAVIVPVGSKGGFVPKQMPVGGDREAIQAEGIACYKLFVGSLLEITDNIEGEDITPPNQVVRHDGDDPYLVVAADKGTATFSDIANGISEGHEFWLGDAFASGGSAGYDHKKMGITARGGWEAVKRHFREMDIDIQSEPFSVVGVGDMSGDVFGNGMLLSQKIRLLAAFDHRDIFIDPDPDPATSYKERQRLFELPRSSWKDYDTKLISKGGGVFSRQDKAIPVSAEMKALLGLQAKTATPNEVMQAILKADADLLWFGGIGTYVRAPHESDDEVGDRANDAIRVTSDDLRVKVVGEGANLGITHPARIAFARKGGRVNSDAIDNSAGVNSSDLEVNIKIALASVMRAGKLGIAERNKFLAAMTEDVAALCLRNNYLQTLALSLAERRGPENLGFAQRMMRDLEQRGKLDREVEYLPEDLVIAEMADKGLALTRPELAVLLAYAKIDLYESLLSSAIPDDPYLSRELNRYMPDDLWKKYPDAVDTHRLRREIIATMLSNSMVNRGGPTFLVRVRDETGAAFDEISGAFALARDGFGMTDMNGEIDALDNKIPGAVQIELYSDVRDLLMGSVVWFLRNEETIGGLKEKVAHYRKGIAAIAKSLDSVLPPAFRMMVEHRHEKLVGAGVPKGLADQMSGLMFLSRAPDIIRIADDNDTNLKAAAETFYALGEMFSIGPLITQAQDLRLNDYYERIALSRTVDAMSIAQRRITGALVSGGKKGAAAIEAWQAEHGTAIERVQSSLADLTKSDLTVAKLAVAAGLFSDLARD